MYLINIVPEVDVSGTTQRLSPAYEFDVVPPVGVQVLSNEVVVITYLEAP